MKRCKREEGHKETYNVRLEWKRNMHIRKEKDEGINHESRTEEYSYSNKNKHGKGNMYRKEE